MSRTNPPTEKRVNSSTIGAIGLVVIAVLLVGILGAYVVTTSEDAVRTPPDANLSFTDTPSGDILIRHESGEAIPLEHTRILVNGQDVEGVFPAEDDGELTLGESGVVPDDSFTIGDDITVVYDTPDITPEIIARYKVQ